MKRYQTHQLTCDVFVAGGGMSGVCCAIAAARQGVKVILCQDRPVLGGNASSEIRMHIVGANTDRPAEDLVVEARESGLIEEIRLENSVRNPQRSPSMFDEILYEKCRAEVNLTLMLNTTVTDASIAGSIITQVEAVRASTEDRFEISAEVFVDCTGDGGLGAAVDAAFTHGREAQTQFNETLAPVEADHKTLGSTLLFMARKHDKPMPYTPPSWARKIVAEDLVHRMWGDPGKEFTYEYGFWWLEWGGHLDTIKQNEAIRDELLSILFGVWDFVKNQGDYNADNWSLDWFGVVPGKRESRRFIGQHVLTERDVLTSVPQPDAIAYGGWPIDLHPVHGFDQKDATPCVWNKVPLLYDVPLRSCVARDIGNLMFAGRNISSSHVAFASTRVMATCSVIGEGVGISAAHSVKLKLRPAEISGNASAMDAIREAILQEDGYLIGIDLTDAANRLRAATLSASSEAPEGPANNVLSGQNRALSGSGSVADERKRLGTHRWISAANAELPAWIQATWSAPQEISRLEIVFDTGLYRLLTLSQSDSYFGKMIWGKPSPETVRDFSVEIQKDGAWTTLFEVTDNGLRRWQQTLSESVTCTALRVTVKRTWGITEARIIRLAAW